ncbi:uncharacterized protein LOC135144465 [Zophobas morio]|uniref:uncharacterized protein LOC135144465 n=1 Tax=Zophobas morio TaxID=2755281 RepID=UPI003082857C
MVNYALKLKLLYYENFLVKTDGKWENRDFLVQENVILKRIRSRIKGEVGRLFELTASDRSRGCSYDEVKEVYDVVFMHQDEIYSTLWEQPNPAGSACKSTSLERAESFLSPTEHPDFAYKEEINKLTKKIDYLREKLFFYEEKERKDGDYLRKYDELEALYSSTKAKLYEMEDENALLKTRFTALSVEVKEAKCSYQEAREHNDALLKNIKRLANRKHWALLHELRGRFPNVHLQSFKSGLEGNKNNTALLRKTFPTMTHKVEENGTAANKSDSAREQDEEAPGIIVTNSVRDVEKRKIGLSKNSKNKKNYLYLN